MEKLDNLVGKEVGEYHVEEKIGDGAFLTVFKGRKTNIPRNVAVKVLNDNMQSDRLRAEVDALAELGGHQHIVELYDADPSANNPYLVVEYCDSSIKQELERHGRVKDWQKATQWTNQLLDALSYVHKKGRVHRDIKPSNILLSNGNVKLSDFNSSMNSDPATFAKSMAQSVSLAEQGKHPQGLEGTVLYWTPEERKCREITKQTDIHKVGQVLHEMLTGDLFLDRDRSSSASTNGSPKWLDNVITKATYTDPTMRYASADEMKADLQKGLEGKFDQPKTQIKLGGLLKKVGKSILTGLKYVGLGVTAPIWGPIGLVKRAFDEDDLVITSVLGAVAYYGTAGGLGLNHLENKAEEQTKAVARAQFEQMPEDLHLGYIVNNKLRVTPLKSIFDENPPATEFALPNYELIWANRQWYLPSMATGEDTFLYNTKEKIPEGGTFPQINALNLTSGKLEKLIGTLKDGNSWLKDKLFEEAHMSVDEQTKTPYAIVKIDGIYHKVLNGDLQRMDSMSLPLPQNIGNVVYCGDLEFRKGLGDLEVNRKNSLWGDVELFDGNTPMLIRYSPKAEK